MEDLDWFRIIACNVRGTNTKPHKLQQLYSIMNANDILVLTETNLTQETLTASQEHNPPECCNIFTTRHNTKRVGSGITIVTGPAISKASLSHDTLVQGFLTVTRIRRKSQDIIILGVYNAPDNRSITEEIISEISDIINTHADSHVIITGDLNAGLRTTDRTTEAPPTEQEQSWRKVVQDFELQDVVALKNPHDKSLYTYTHPATGSRSRIDHILTTETLSEKCVQSSIEGGIWKPADHYAVMATFNLRKRNLQVDGPTVQRTPTTDLYDTDLTKQIHELFESLELTEPSQNLDAQKAQLALKAQVSRIVTAYTVGKTAKEHAQLQTHKNKLKRAKEQIARSPREARDFLQKENRLNKALRLHTENKILRRSIILNKQAGIPLSIPSYTAHRLAAPHVKGTLRNAEALRDPKTGLLRTDTQGMAEALVNFYQTLFTSEQTPRVPTDSRFLLSQPIPKLTPEQKADLLREATLDEVETLFSRLKPGKAPGPDGIGNDVYRAFKDKWAPHFLRVIREFQSTQTLLPDFLSAVIAPFYKEKGEREDLANWRPVTLLNTDYKLLALFIVNRLTPLMEKLIGPGQTSSVPGRTTFDNIHAVRLLQFVSTLDEHIDTALIFLDSEKAFDRVEWEYMWTTLTQMEFPPTYINMIKCLYAGATAMVRINGLRTRAFPLTRGVRQGCPLSPLLYVLSLEPIRNYIHTWLTRNRGKPTWLSHDVPPSYAHADDLTIFVEASQAIQLVRNLQTFIGPDFLASGMKIHAGKSIILYMKKHGTLQCKNTSSFTHLSPHEFQVFHIDDENLDLKHLGLPFGGKDPEGRIREAVVKRIEAIIAQIAPTHIPFLEKVQLLTAKISGVLQFYAQTLHFEAHILDKLAKQIRDAFYAAHKQHKYMIRDDRLFVPRAFGGAGLLHPRYWCEAFKRNQLSRLHRGFSRPTDHKLLKHTDPSLVSLFKLAVLLTSHIHLNKNFDPSTFFWLDPTHRAEIARHMPSYWKGIITHHDNFLNTTLYNNKGAKQGFLKAYEDRFPLDAVLNAPIITTQTLPEVKDCDWLIETDKRDHEGKPLFLAPLYMCFDTEFSHQFADPNASIEHCDAQLQWRLKTATQYDLDIALDLVLHPAYMMPFVALNTPPASVTKHHYLQVWKRTLDSFPENFSPSAEWVRVAPALENPKRPLQLRDEVFELMEKGWKGKNLVPLVKSHQWTLWQRRLTACFVSCPWCGKEKNAEVLGEEKFMHEAWVCPSFRTHWNNLRPTARVPHVSSIAEIALGVDPQRPNKAIKKEHRLRALMLHAALWHHKPRKDTPNRTVDYKSTLTTYFYFWKRANPK
jgi:exonuclease III